MFVHVYIHHFDRIIIMGAEAHVNTCYKHFYYFVTELNLIDRKELEPLVSILSLSRHLKKKNPQIFGFFPYIYLSAQIVSLCVHALSNKKKKIIHFGKILELSCKFS